MNGLKILLANFIFISLLGYGQDFDFKQFENSAKELDQNAIQFVAQNLNDNDLKQLSEKEKLFVYSTIADSYQSDGYYDKAMKFNWKSIRLIESLYGRQNEEFANRQIALARDYFDANERQRSEELYLHSINILKQLPEVDRLNLGHTYCEMGSYMDFNNTLNYLEEGVQYLSNERFEIDDQNLWCNELYAHGLLFNLEYTKALELFQNIQNYREQNNLIDPGYYQNTYRILALKKLHGITYDVELKWILNNEQLLHELLHYHFQNYVEIASGLSNLLVSDGLVAQALSTASNAFNNVAKFTEIDSWGQHSLRLNYGKLLFTLNNIDLAFEVIIDGYTLVQYNQEYFLFDDYNFLVCELLLAKRQFHYFADEISRGRHLDITKEEIGGLVEFTFVMSGGKKIRELKNSDKSSKIKYLEYLALWLDYREQTKYYFPNSDHSYILKTIAYACEKSALLLGEGNDQQLNFLQRLYRAYFERGMYRESYETIEKFDSLWRNSYYGIMTPIHLEDIIIVSSYYGNHDTTLLNESTREYYDIIMESAKESVHLMSPSQIRTFKGPCEFAFGAYAETIRESNGNHGEIIGLYKDWLFINGLATNKSSNLKDLVYETKDPTTEKLYEDFLTVKNELSNAYGSKKPEEEIIQLRAKLSEAENNLFSFSNTTILGSSTIELNDIQKLLNKEELLIDIVRIEKPNLESFYTCFLITRDSLVWKDLNTGKLLTDDYLRIYNSYQFGTNRNNADLEGISCSNLLGPIIDEFQNYKKIYVSNSGIYNRINFNTLLNAKSSKYLIDEINIVYVNGARGLMKQKLKPNNSYDKNTAVLMGNPNFNSSIQLETDEEISEEDIQTAFLHRSISALNSLQGTQHEIEKIEELLQEALWTTESYYKDEASESTLKGITSPRILHIATHGYFVDEDQIGKSKELLNSDSINLFNEPLLRSAIYLAGAQNTIKGEKPKSTIDNGIFTAYEASLLDLYETELVVLSACETGRGEFSDSESIAGLRLAFMEAGADKIIYSLWKVDDNVTQEFMTTFYSTWLNGKTIRQAFNETQLIIKDKYPQPYYWGAFVLVGE